MNLLLGNSHEISAEIFVAQSFPSVSGHAFLKLPPSILIPFIYMFLVKFSACSHMHLGKAQSIAMHHFIGAGVVLQQCLKYL